MATNAPDSQPRRILLAVTGLSPQIVTETLYALAVQSSPAWIPDEVWLVTTATGAREARLNLLSADTGWFHRLRADYGLPAMAFDEARIHVLTDGHGEPLDDIRTPHDNERAADFITEIVRDLTKDADTELHVSIAGGRKTLGFYLGYALSLFGRPQDRLSHVLVSEPFESQREFFYPTPYVHAIHVRRNGKEQTFDAREARVDLAEIPFVRLREGLPERLRDGEAAFSHVVAVANRAQTAPRLVIDVATHDARMDGEPLPLGNVDFAVLLWLAERARRRAGAVDWSVAEAAEEFLGIVERVINPASGEYDRIDAALAWRKSASIKQAKYFEPHKSRINRAIETLLGARGAERYAIQRIKTDQGYRFQLPLDHRQITIKP